MSRESNTIQDRKNKDRALADLESDSEERRQNAQLWLDSQKPMNAFKILGIQVAIIALFMVLLVTPLAPVAWIYIACLPVILAVQGELWPTYLGQLIQVKDRDWIDSVVRGILLGIAGAAATSLGQDQAVYAIIFMASINLYSAGYILEAVKYIKQLMEGDMDSYERVYTEYKYGWHLLHIPAITTIITILLGAIVSLILNYSIRK